MDIIKRINEIAVRFFEGNNTRFAERMGTSEANIRNYRSKITPKVDFLVKLCNELEISFDWLFNGTGDLRRAAHQGGAVAMDLNPNYMSLIKQKPYGGETDTVLINENEILSQEVSLLRKTVEAQEKTIRTQEKLIERLEKLLEPKSGGKGATEPATSGATRTKSGQLEHR